MTKIKQIDRDVAVSLFLDVLGPVASYAEWGYSSDREKATLEITEILAAHREAAMIEGARLALEAAKVEANTLYRSVEFFAMLHEMDPAQIIKEDGDE